MLRPAAALPAVIIADPTSKLLSKAYGGNSAAGQNRAGDVLRSVRLLHCLAVDHGGCWTAPGVI